MPVLEKNRGNQWLARLIVNGSLVKSKLFPPGRKKGTNWMAARNWEVETRKAVESLMETGLNLAQALLQVGITPSKQVLEALDIHQKRATLLAYEQLLQWGESYLTYVEQTMQSKTKTEKETILKAFFAFCKEEKITFYNDVTKPKVYTFLSKVAKEKSPNRANVYRKNLLAAWNFGISYIEGFPQSSWIIDSIPLFKVEHGERYVPPEKDVIKVLKEAEGQDLVMLLTYYFTGGRRSELFRLSWTHDVCLEEARIRLTDNKGKNGQKRVRWYAMHPELVKAYTWWKSARPCDVDNVFMQTHCASSLGEPFTQRQRFMTRLCERAGVKPFGFHGLRHKSAAITFAEGGVAAAQILMGHERATTTDRYVRSTGQYMDHGVIVDALGSNGIGQEGIRLLQEIPLEKEKLLEGSIQEAKSKHEIVNTLIQ